MKVTACVLLMVGWRWLTSLLQVQSKCLRSSGPVQALTSPCSGLSFSHPDTFHGKKDQWICSVQSPFDCRASVRDTESGRTVWRTSSWSSWRRRRGRSTWTTGRSTSTGSRPAPPGPSSWTSSAPTDAVSSSPHDLVILIITFRHPHRVRVLPQPQDQSRGPNIRRRQGLRHCGCDSSVK